MSQYHIWLPSYFMGGFWFHSLHKDHLVQGGKVVRRQWLHCCTSEWNLLRHVPNVRLVSIFCHVSYVGGDQVMSQQVIRQHVPHATTMSTLRLHSSSPTPVQHMSPYWQNIYPALSLTCLSLIKVQMSIVKHYSHVQ